MVSTGEENKSFNSQTLDMKTFLSDSFQSLMKPEGFLEWLFLQVVTPRYAFLYICHESFWFWRERKRESKEDLYFRVRLNISDSNSWPEGSHMAPA